MEIEVWGQKWMKSDGNCCGTITIHSVDQERDITINSKSRQPKMAENACSSSKMQAVGRNGYWH